MFRIIAWSILATQLLIIAPLQNYWYWSKLPAQVATHFDVTGAPDAWMHRTSATLMMFAFQIGLPVFVLTIVGLMDRLPTSMINVPNREYWLSGSRREETLQLMFRQFLILTIVLSLFISGVNHLTFTANMQGVGLNNTLFLVWFSAFLIFIAVFIGNMLICFRLPRTESNSDNACRTSETTAKKV